MNYFNNFKQFLNESQTSKFNFYDQDLNVKFPWEDSIIKSLEEAKKYIEEAKMYDYERYSSDCFTFDIKIHTPWHKGIEELYDITDDELLKYFSRFREEQLEYAIEKLKEEHSWIEEINQQGSSGGWLEIEPDRYNKLQRFIDDIYDTLNEYENSLDETDYEGEEITPELLQKKRSSLVSSNLGLSDNQLGNEVKRLKSTCSKTTDEINVFVTEIKTLCQNLTEVKKLIDDYLKTFYEDFKEWFPDEIENDSL